MKIKRDRKGIDKTLAYFMTKERTGKSTSVKTAARALGVKPPTMSARLATMRKRGLLIRVSRGVYTGPVAAEVSKQIATSLDKNSLEHLLGQLEAKRIVLDSQINTVRAAIAVQKEYQK